MPAGHQQTNLFDSRDRRIDLANHPTLGMSSKRSDSEVTSSNSAETSRTAQHASRKVTSLRGMNSIAPISTPRVGCETSKSFAANQTRAR